MEGGTTLIMSAEVVGVSVQEDAEHPAYHYVRLRRMRGEIRTLATGTAKDAVELKRCCGTRAPLALNIDTPRCLHRVAPGHGELATTLAQAFPGVHLEQLTASGWQQGRSQGVSMMRRAATDVIGNALRGQGFRIVNLSIGPWGVLQLRSLLGDRHSDGNIANHRFQMEEEHLVAYASSATSEGVITLGEDELPQSHLAAFAAAWEHLVPPTARLALADPLVQRDQREERARLWYERGLLALVLVLLGMIGADAALGEHVRRTTGGTEHASYERGQLNATIEHLRRTLTEQEALVDQLGMGKERQFAIRAMRVLHDVPPGILLDRVNLDPLTAVLREREHATVIHDRIRMTGTCSDGQVLNGWMETLRGTAGVRSVTLAAYTIDVRTQRPTFTLLLDA